MTTNKATDSVLDISSYANTEDAHARRDAEEGPPGRPRTSRLRSTGCKTCRQRKIKCDEQKPVCRNCNKSQRTCLGYTNLDAYTFRDENERFGQYSTAPSLYRDTNIESSNEGTSSAHGRRDSSMSIFSEPFFEDSESGLREGGGNSNSSAYHHQNDLQSTTTEIPHRSVLLPSSAPSKVPTQSLAFQLETFFCQKILTSVWIHTQAESWQYWIPKIMHNSAALHSSVMSLSALYMARGNMNPKTKNLALSLYQVTLGHLQKALREPTLACRDETLMATIITGLYELLDKPGHATWATHSRGTAELMKLRGPNLTKTATGRMIFLTFRGYEVIRAILQCEATFVADKVWTMNCASTATRHLIDSLVDDTSPRGASGAATRNDDDDDDDAIDYASVLFLLGAEIANFHATCARYHQSGTLTQARSQNLESHAAILDKKLTSWHDKTPQNLGTQICFYAAFLLLLHRTVACYVLHERVAESDVALAHLITSTAQLLLHGHGSNSSSSSTTIHLYLCWPLYMATTALRNGRELQTALDALKTISRDKGWAVAESAVTAVEAIMEAGT